jgi:hypothetical protein
LPTPSAARIASAIALVFAMACAVGCVEIDGGAVELSWSLRTFEGEPVDACGDARIDEIRINWRPMEQPSAAPMAFRDFPCEDSTGVTGFGIAPGQQLFWAEPICADGALADEGTFESPAPILRRVDAGAVVTLNSLLIVVDPTAPPQSCRTGAPCTCVRASP